MSASLYTATVRRFNSLRRTDDAHGDFAAIGNQELVEHAAELRLVSISTSGLSRLDRRFVIDEKTHDFPAACPP